MGRGTRVGSIGKRKRENVKLVIKDGEGSRITRKLKNGDRVDVLNILFSRDIYHLITNDGRQVYPNHLIGKVIVLHFVPLAPWSARLKHDVDTLVDIYNALHPKGCFQVVFIGFEVPKHKRCSLKKYAKSPEEYFKEIFSIMPWTAIPFSHIHSLKYWRSILRYPMYPSGSTADSLTFSLVINPAGVVLQRWADNIFHTFGAEAYPFTDKRVRYLEHQDKKALDSLSITQLLTSPGYEHVINCENKEVPIKDLQDKVVALYFYEDSYQSFHTLTQILKDAYRELMPAKQDEFEVVLVYLHHSIDAFGRASENSFWNALQGMPWLALPFKHPKVKNLQRIFDYRGLEGSVPDPRLVIIGSRGNFVEPYGVDIFTHCRASAYPLTRAYPFTRKEVAKLDVEYIKSLKLDMFWDPNTSFTRGKGSEEKLSQLTGKKIMLIFEDFYHDIYPEFWHSLTDRYHSMKKMGDLFEVIHVPYMGKDSSCCKYDSTLPWLKAPPFPEKSDKQRLVWRVFRGGTGLLAFDGDGRVVRRTINLKIQKGNTRFPFYDGGIEKEALKDLRQVFQWCDDRSELVRGL